MAGPSSRLDTSGHAGISNVVRLRTGRSCLAHPGVASRGGVGRISRWYKDRAGRTVVDETSPQVDSASFVVPAGYAPRTAWTVLHYQLTPPRGTFFIIICLAAIAVTPLAWSISPILVAVGAAMLLVIALVLLVMWRNTERYVRATWVVGTTLYTEFERDTFTIREPSSTITTRYDAIKSLHVWKDMVALTPVTHATPAMYPADLFPERIRHRFATGEPRSRGSEARSASRTDRHG